MSATFDALAQKYRPVFARIADGALAREQDRVLPTEQVGWLKDVGFTGIRVPAEFGGDGASLVDLFRLLIELAAADPHVPQAFRGHLAFVEDRLVAPGSAERDEWLHRFAGGEMVGNAVTEIGSVALGDTTTRLSSAEGDGWLLSGRKYYTTGSIFAEWIDATALLPDGTEVAALVSTAGGRVTVSDDWNGFGQRLTGSGTAIFEQAPVRAEHVYPFSRRFWYQTALYQLVLVAVQAGIARASARDAVTQLSTRARAFSHGNSAESRHDPQLLESVGRVDAAAYAAEAVVLRAAASLQAAYDARDGSETERATLKRDAELDTARAQVIAGDLAQQAATRLFDALGASATAAPLQLDRHWRNARTVSSHNPALFKARVIGDALVNDAEPPYEWYVGVPKKVD
ncbi:acyl-CoA dehydrogenase family protein [Salinibacterium sp. ZJ450]|uniref:acyl-CoA dehydrogenase family protein n=1 Tax=Salinibacterium sp. ZJ450 TaxID=2708338 RepID=UPI0014212C44|nr:acyl-CoA dehydrogenase family protein [Salinibacterium sp. ZJ450]